MKLIEIETSKGPVVLLLDGETVIPYTTNDSDILSDLYSYSWISIVHSYYNSGWLRIGLDDADYGCPEYKYKDLGYTLPADFIAKHEAKKAEAIAVAQRAEQNRNETKLIREFVSELIYNLFGWKPDENQWYHKGRLHREDGPAVEYFSSKEYLCRSTDEAIKKNDNKWFGSK